MEDVASALEQLSSPSAGPWQEVSALWRETVRARLRYLYYEEGTLQEYFNKYPILKSSDGWRLLTYDYEALFPDKSGGLDALDASSENILKAAQQKLNTTKDSFLFNLLLKVNAHFSEPKEAKESNFRITCMKSYGTSHTYRIGRIRSYDSVRISVRSYIGLHLSNSKI